MFHTGDWLMLRFDVAERYTAALVTEDNGEVWTDSCAEFFIAPDTGMYYNFETTCIGRMLLGARKSRTEAEHASPEVLAGVKRYTTLPCGEPFAEREGDNRWSLTLAIPPQALFRHALTDWSGLKARMNLYKCGDNLSHPHFLSWRPIRTEKPDFHRPEFFGEVTFEKRKVESEKLKAKRQSGRDATAAGNRRAQSLANCRAATAVKARVFAP